jgi:hypothetical protein
MKANLYRLAFFCGHKSAITSKMVFEHQNYTDVNANSV